MTDVNSEKITNILREQLKDEHFRDPTVVGFIHAYVACRDHRQAAKQVGITGIDGRSLINRRDIVNAINKLTEEAINKYGYDAAEVVERVKEIAFFDPLGLVEADGTYKKNINHIPPELRRALKKLRVKNIYEEDANGVPQYKGEIIEYEFWDKPKSLELLAREKDTFKKTTVVEHDVSKNMRNILLDAAKRGEDRVRELEAPVRPVKDVSEVVEAVVVSSGPPIPVGVK